MEVNDRILFERYIGEAINGMLASEVENSHYTNNTTLVERAIVIAKVAVAACKVEESQWKR